MRAIAVLPQPLLIPGLALALFVTRIGTADHEHDAAAPHDLAVLADFLY
jgi:hypothetical protein